MPIDTDTIAYGQDVYFLGFQYGYSVSGKNVNGDRPMPLVKRATMSGSLPASSHPSAKSVMIILDGYNNPGFSGAPIVYRDEFNRSTNFRILGVVTSFVPEIVDVLTTHDIKTKEEASDIARQQPWRIKERPDGSFFEYKNTGQYVSLNTGLVQGYLLFPALDLIHKNSTGPIVRVAK